MPKEFSRTDRVGELIQRELAKVIQKEVKDPRIGMLTVSAVKVSGDLAHAKVYISQLGTAEEVAKTVTVLNKASGFLRTVLAKKVKLRIAPQLHFVHDKSIEEGGRLSSLIDKAIEESDAIKKNSDAEE